MHAKANKHAKFEKFGARRANGEKLDFSANNGEKLFQLR